MIFGQSKPKGPVAPQIQWPIVGAKRQSVPVKPDRYRYVVSGSYGHWSVDLEGSTPVMPDLRISVTFRHLDPFEPPRRLLDSWGKLPDSVEGTCSFHDLGPAQIPQLNAEIFCQGSTTPLILQALQCFSAPGSVVLLELEIDFPDEHDDQFWIATWREKELRIRTWRFIAEGARSSVR